MGEELTDCIRSMYDSRDRVLRLIYRVIVNQGEKYHYDGVKAFHAVRDEILPSQVQLETGICPSYVQIVTALEPLFYDGGLFNPFRANTILGDRKLFDEGDMADFRLSGARYDRYLAIEGDSRLLFEMGQSVEIGLRKGKSLQGATVTLKFWDKFDVKQRVYDRLLEAFGEDFSSTKVFTYEDITDILCTTEIMNYDFRRCFSAIEGFEDNLLPYNLKDLSTVSALDL
jgi:hypothetical protein